MEQAILAKARVDELSDETIVERVRAGDVALYEIIVRRHNQRLYRTIRAVLRKAGWVVTSLTRSP